MARTNGPIQVWHRTDTIPTDAEGGYAGGDSTAAAIALFQGSVDGIEQQLADHAARHATGGPDPIAPADIGASPAGHEHSWSQVTGKPVNFPPSSHTHSWAEVTGKPASFPPTAHVHTPAEVGSVPADDPRLRDTGWRNITSLVSPTVASGELRIRRIGNEVSFWPRSLSFAENISNGTRILPTSGGLTASGFRPDPSARISFRCNRSNQLATVMNTVLYRSGDSLVWTWYSLERIDLDAPRTFTLDSGFPIAGFTSWITDEAWPATPPGTPA